MRKHAVYPNQENTLIPGLNRSLTPRPANSAFGLPHESRQVPRVGIVDLGFNPLQRGSQPKARQVQQPVGLLDCRLIFPRKPRASKAHPIQPDRFNVESSV